MGQLLAILARQCQCYGATCHSSCMDDCWNFDFEREAESESVQVLDLPYVHWERHPLVI